MNPHEPNLNDSLVHIRKAVEMQKQTPLAAGTFLKNRYQVKEILGQGGMGKVYRAFDIDQKRHVAIKIVLRSLDAENKKLLARAHREYLFLSSTNHPHLVKAYDFFTGDNRVFLVMEFIRGISLQGFIENHPRSLPLLEQVAMSAQICRAVQALNTAGILHRDVKPANVMVDPGKRSIKLLDLGLGKEITNRSMDITGVGSIVGTPEYLSPEQVDGSVSKLSDVFSLGITLYQFFLWEKYSPFKADSSVTTMIKVSQHNPPPLLEKLISQTSLNEKDYKLYQAISNILQQALEKDYRRRLPGAGQLADHLDSIYHQYLMDTFCKQEIVVEDNIDADDSTKRWNPGTRLRTYEIEHLENFAKQHGKDEAFSETQDAIKTKTRKREEIRNYTLSYKKRQKTKSKSYVIVAAIVGILVVVGWWYRRALWDDQLQDMHNSFNKISRVNGENFDQQISLWEKFLQQYTANNPYSSIDENLREKATTTIEVLKKQKVAHEKEKQAEKHLQISLEAHSRMEYPKAWQEIEMACSIIETPKILAQKAFLLFLGLGVEKDTALANKLAQPLLEDLMKKDDSFSLCMVGTMYFYGIGVEQDLDKSLHWLNLAALKEYPFAFHMIAIWHGQKRSGVQNTLLWFQKAAEHGHVLSMISLAEYYTYLRQNHQAIVWYKKAVEYDSQKATTKLGNLYDITKQYSLAMEMYKKAASLGDEISMYNIATMYYYGRGVVKDYQQALEWFLKSAEHKDTYAPYFVAYMYWNGQGTTVDFQKSVYWYEESFKVGDQRSGYNLGNIYYHGLGGVRQDYAKAFYYFESTAKKGYSAAMKMLGHMYEKGLGVPQNLPKAVEWKQKAEYYKK